jgi:putative glutathione S-transferase
MGRLVDGVWRDEWYDTEATGGRFVREDTRFRSWVTPDGRPGPTGEGGFAAERGRYHLYVSYACPWAHRTLIFRMLKDLVGAIDVSVVHWLMGEHGWTFDEGPGTTGDRLFGSRFLSEIYLRADPRYTGRVTVPVLWDTKRGTIVSNESADIIRMLNASFDGVGARGPDFYPEPLRAEVDRVNAIVYDRVNNGVYKAGFATAQGAHEEAVTALFETLDDLERCLGRQRRLAGDHLTEADWRLFTTLLRFDAVYVGHFKCNLRRLVDFPRLWSYARELYQVPGVAETVRFDHIKKHYYRSHRRVNPTGIVPLGPLVDWNEPHGRDGV